MTSSMKQYFRQGLVLSSVLLTCGACLSHATKPGDSQPGDSQPGYGKPGAALDFSSDYDGLTKSGEIETVRIQVRDGYEAGTLTLRILDSPDLNIYTDSREVSFDLTGDAVHTIDVQFALADSGTDYPYLNILGTVELPNGARMQQSFGVPISSSDAPQNKPQLFTPADQPEVAGSQGVIVMDAVETVRVLDEK